MRRAGLITLFALGAGVLLAALLWILRLGERMEAAELEARRHAVQEERARLALWRMDSALATFLAAENAQPVAAPGGSRAIDPPFVRERFEVGAVEAAGGQVPDRERLLALLGQPPLAAAGPSPAPAAPAPSTAAVDGARPPAIPATAAARAVEPAPAEPKAASPAAKETAPARKGSPPDEPAARDPIVERESANQSQLNVAEFEKRLKVAGLQSEIVPGTTAENPPLEPRVDRDRRPSPASAGEPDNPPPQPPPAGNQAGVAHPAGVGTASIAGDLAARGGGSNPTGAGTGSTAGDPADRGGPTASVPGSGAASPGDRAHTTLPAARPPRRPGRPSGPTGVVRTLVPVWADDGRLLLVRRVVRDGAESLQGLALDPAATRDWLLEEVRDLLPAGDLEPVAATEEADPGRRLALLPWRLVPGPPPEVDPAGGPSSVRLGLALATSAILAVGLAAAFALVAGLRLARRRTEFASAVIHELRTPLTTFQLYTDMLAERMVPPAEEPRYLDTLRREAGRLGHLVENVLAFARLERRRAPEARRIALVPAVAELAETLRERAAAEGFELHFAVEPEAETVEVAVDPTAVERILHNLLDNSLKYGRGEGEDGSRLDLGVALAGRTAVVRWRDRGPGIPRRARRWLFKPFQRGEPGGGEGAGTAAGAGAGIGLGLALSRQLARRFGGDLRCAEPEGPGAAFELSLPLAPAGGDGGERTGAG